MSEERKVELVQPHYKIPPLYISVAIYCRVSTSHDAQEDSLESQIDRFKKMVNSHYKWKLVGIYSDIASGKSTTGRAEFNRLLDDCKNGKVDLILTKSISRFGRNTVDILENIYKLRRYDTDAFFEIEQMRISETGQDFLLSVLSALAQEDSTSRSQNIKIGIKFQMQNGTSKLYSRPCYGYIKDSNNVLVIDNENAKNVRLIFNLYLQGHSIVSIIKELEQKGIKSPSGKDVWSKRAVENLLANEKYIGNVIVGKTYGGEFPNNKRYANKGETQKFLSSNNHEPIITLKTFDLVQEERQHRSNIHTVDGQSKRKSTHYSVKSVFQCNDKPLDSHEKT